MPLWNEQSCNLCISERACVCAYVCMIVISPWLLGHWLRVYVRMSVRVFACVCVGVHTISSDLQAACCNQVRADQKIPSLNREICLQAAPHPEIHLP